MSEKLKMSKLAIENTAESEQLLRDIGCDEAGIAIMKEKLVFRVVRVENVPLKAAIILKQTFLAKGGEAATARGVAGLTAETSDVVLMGTLKQYRLAIAALRGQPFGLKELAADLSSLLFK